jgi:hypothetical protein
MQAMSQVLIDKIRKGRNTLVYTGGFGFTVRRPTDLEAVTVLRQKMDMGDFLRRFVVDWVDVRESDLINGGSPVPVPFDADLFIEWIVDKPTLWGDLHNAINAAYETHIQSLEKSVGEPAAG